MQVSAAPSWCNSSPRVDLSRIYRIRPMRELAGIDGPQHSIKTRKVDEIKRISTRQCADPNAGAVPKLPRCSMQGACLFSLRYRSSMKSSPERLRRSTRRCCPMFVNLAREKIKEFPGHELLDDHRAVLAKNLGQDSCNYLGSLS